MTPSKIRRQGREAFDLNTDSDELNPYTPHRKWGDEWNSEDWLTGWREAEAKAETTLTAKLTYFKLTGKYYSDAEIEVEDLPLFKIWTSIRKLMDTGKLPGLVHGHGDFIILVEVPGHGHEHPRLLIPEMRR